MVTQRGVIGAWGETQATFFLQRQGFILVARNYHTTRGEIDIVAKKGDDYYFIEVKTRRVGAMAYDLSVTPAKIHKLRATVRYYCYEKRLAEVGIILASLMVVVNPVTKAVQFRLAVLL